MTNRESTLNTSSYFTDNTHDSECGTKLSCTSINLVDESN